MRPHTTHYDCGCHQAEIDRLRGLLRRLVEWAASEPVKDVEYSAWAHGVQYRPEDVAIWNEARSEATALSPAPESQVGGAAHLEAPATANPGDDNRTGTTSTSQAKCPECKGKGTKTAVAAPGRPFVKEQHTCPACHGSGTLRLRSGSHDDGLGRCEDCHGTGRKE